MPLARVTITGTFDDGSGNPLPGYVTFRPSQAVYASGIPVLQPDVPVTAQISGGQLESVELVATDNSGLSVLTQTGWWYWTVQVVIGGETLPAWSFFLPHSPSTADLYSLANTPAVPSGGGITPPAGDLGGTTLAPTVTGTHLASPLPLVQGGTGQNAASDAALLAALGALQAADSLSDVASAPAARTNLGLGSAAVQPSSAFDAAGSAAAAQSAAEGYADTSKLAKSANLSDLASAPAARTNLGLGSAAVQNSGAFDAAGAAATAQGNAESFAATAVGTETSRAETAEALLAPLASPALTGSPTAPTQTTGDATAKIATDAFVAAAVAAETSRAETAEALALPKSGGTMTGALAPAVTALAFASTILVNAALGNVFTLTLTASTGTAGVPSNPVSGQVIEFDIAQDGTGSRTVAWAGGAGGYEFGTAGAPVLSTAAGATDLVAFRYSAAKARWLYLGASLGFS